MEDGKTQPAETWDFGEGDIWWVTCPRLHGKLRRQLGKYQKASGTSQTAQLGALAQVFPAK